MRVQSYRDLDVYKLAFELQQHVFKVSKLWPPEEKYALTDQVRRSSRSIGANIAEAWSKRRYPAHFLSKCTDADGELQETVHWIETAKSCEYMITEEHYQLLLRYAELGRKLGSVIQNYESFCKSV
ncbi:MAG TPA: four helix bundle protein [Lentisphaeria bacterium]|nr:MAG: four helix bundle protein [Lentisphaerae bacterium GWF2_50_93]HCE42092.1 four helix bundle protein [Lentisphaeria bacterium]